MEGLQLDYRIPFPVFSVPIGNSSPQWLCFKPCSLELTLHPGGRPWLPRRGSSELPEVLNLPSLPLASPGAAPLPGKAL